MKYMAPSQGPARMPAKLESIKFKMTGGTTSMPTPNTGSKTPAKMASKMGKPSKKTMAY